MTFFYSNGLFNIHVLPNAYSPLNSANLSFIPEVTLMGMLEEGKKKWGWPRSQHNL